LRPKLRAASVPYWMSMWNRDIHEKLTVPQLETSPHIFKHCRVHKNSPLVRVQNHNNPVHTTVS
jgi:hypothetical protein